MINWIAIVAAIVAMLGTTAGVAAAPAAPDAARPPELASGPTTVFEGRSPYSHFLVRDFRSTRGLYFVRDSGEVVQESEIDRDAPYRMVVPYTRVMFASYLLRPQQKRSLIVGLGGGAMVHFLRHYDPQQSIDAVEIDPEIVAAAQKWFGVKVDRQTKLITQDAFVFLKRPSAQYDVIYMDAFLKPAGDTDSTGVPLRMKTAAFLKTDVISRLKPGGVVVFNINGHPKMDEDLEIIRGVFPQTYRFGVPGTNNLIVIGSTFSARLGREQLERAGAAVDGKFHADFSFKSVAGQLMDEPRPNDRGGPR
jgi:spermidine synthase